MHPLFCFLKNVPIATYDLMRISSPSQLPVCNYRLRNQRWALASLSPSSLKVLQWPL